ncbi:MAG: M23 family metallopeptidase [Candidatus Paraimprobicoccus trichonymphae]|uniref:M23 family metallopeptidase n=1 Tax=Candidatus Paraimprobicoccus trichonymphae TaxID=3033793 RepID=A0AA48I235_9FIRM|nr:MAG: M23 family metallopeptidase [Candidatus Paraimprobicoccus trichonymphae]
MIFHFFKTKKSVDYCSGGIIKYVKFNPTYECLEKAMKEDINSYGKEVKINWIEILSVLAVKYGDEFKKYKESDITDIVKNLNEKKTAEKLAKNKKNYDYYLEAYTAILSGFLGTYKDKNNEEKYGLKVYSPIPNGYYFTHGDDFGNSRTFGFKRPHLGHDLMALTGTPVIAVESGNVEIMGWNRYGGWRIGIRSFDKKRYYYYAHLRKNRPYHVDLKENQPVQAGQVIGYVGRTGYSDKENTNNIDKPHLHIGLQLVFDESQKECDNEIWLNFYEITKLLEKNKVSVIRNSETKEFYLVTNLSQTN